MKNSKKKSGISLIVLVITILVMIILATAVILTLQDSEILPGANEAKSSSDMATLKEAANTAYSSYLVAKARGKEVGDAQTYVDNALKKQGLDADSVLIKDDKLYVGSGAKLEKLYGDLIGIEVEGYKLNSTTSYKTSGKESTCSSESTETDPHPSTIVRDNNVTWIYIGMDETGNALIAANVTSTLPKMELSGAGGYLNGPQELNEVCNRLYSSDMGIARSMTIEDVTKILEYTGEKGAYFNGENGDYIPTKDKIYTIGELETKNMKTIEYKELPSSLNETDSNFGNILVDYYYINTQEDRSEINENRINIIYSAASGYWLASNCVSLNICASYVGFDVRAVVSGTVLADSVFTSEPYSNGIVYAVRPVVTLNSDIQAVYENGKIVIK